MRCMVFRALVRARIVLVLGAAAMIGGLGESRSQTSNEPISTGNATGQVSSKKLAEGKTGAASKESSELVAAAYQSLQALESMGYFAAETFAYKGRSGLIGFGAML